MVENAPTQYVVGFLFSGDESRVWLIQKKRPKWQAGRLNGVGGHMEENEFPHLAMSREFKEETGVKIHNWIHAITLSSKSFVIYVFKACVTDSLFSRISQTTDEEPVEVQVDEVGTRPTGMCLKIPVLYELKWIVPLLLDPTVKFPLLIEKDLRGDD